MLHKDLNKHLNNGFIKYLEADIECTRDVDVADERWYICVTDFSQHARTFNS